MSARAPGLDAMRDPAPRLARWRQWLFNRLARWEEASIAKSLGLPAERVILVDLSEEDHSHQPFA